MNVPVTPSVLGKTEDEVDQQATESQRKVKEWQDASGWEGSEMEGDDFDPLGDHQRKP